MGWVYAAGSAMTFNPKRIEDIKKFGSYFGDHQVRVLSELGQYITQQGEIPTTDKLVTFTGRPWIEVRNDLNSVTLEGFLWVYGVEAEAAA